MQYLLKLFRFYPLPAPAPDQPIQVEDYLLSPTTQAAEMSFDDGPGTSHLPEDGSSSKHLPIPGRADKELRSPKKVESC